MGSNIFKQFICKLNFSQHSESKFIVEINCVLLDPCKYFFVRWKPGLPDIHLKKKLVSFVLDFYFISLFEAIHPPSSGELSR